MIKLDVKIPVSKEDYLDYVNELMALVESLGDGLMTLNLTDDKSAAIWKDNYFTALDELARVNDDYQSLSDELDAFRNVNEEYERLYLDRCEAYDKLMDENDDLYDYLAIADYEAKNWDRELDEAKALAYYDGVDTDDLIGRISYLHEVIEEAENERDDMLRLYLTSDKNAADELKKYRATNQLLEEEIDGLRDELNYLYDNGTEDDNATIGKQDAVIEDLVKAYNKLKSNFDTLLDEKNELWQAITAIGEEFDRYADREFVKREALEERLETLRDEYEGLEHDYVVLAEHNVQLLDRLLSNQCDDNEEAMRKLERTIAALEGELEALKDLLN